jgi:hypothetical protein
MYSVQNWKKISVNLAFIPVFKPHTRTVYILKHCTDIVYIWQLPSNSQTDMSNKTEQMNGNKC